MLVRVALIPVGALTRNRVRLGVMTCEKVKWTCMTVDLIFKIRFPTVLDLHLLVVLCFCNPRE
jgi:hypothetical protein